MVKKSSIFLKIFIILIIWITPVWSDKYELIVQKSLFSPQRQPGDNETQSNPFNVTLPMVIGMWEQKDTLRALIIAPNDRKEIPRWYTIEEEVNGYKIVNIDLYKEIVKFKSGDSVYEVGMENKSRTAKKSLPVPKKPRSKVSKKHERSSRKSEFPKRPARNLPKPFRAKGK